MKPYTYTNTNIYVIHVSLSWQITEAEMAALTDISMVAHRLRDAILAEKIANERRVEELLEVRVLLPNYSYTHTYTDTYA